MAFFRVLIILFICCWPFSLYADGTYWIGKDEGGVYFQTDQDGGWYISREDLKHFKIGGKGTYLIGSDRYGTYITTDKRKKFYMDIEAKQQSERQIRKFNEAQD